MGWYGMALVDVLDNFPKNHPKRAALLAILNRYAVAVQKVQDQKSGLWYDILNQPNGKGNYHEASAANMFVYTFAKAVRMGYLPASYFAVADKGYKGIKTKFIEQASVGKINLKGTVSVSGLGGKPYRDGSYSYYLSEKVITNDPKGVGAFLLAANEMEIAALPKPGLGKTVTLDFISIMKLKQTKVITPFLGITSGKNWQMAVFLFGEINSIMQVLKPIPYIKHQQQRT